MSLLNLDIYHTTVNQGVALAWVNSYSAVVLKTPGATLLFDPVGMRVPEDACLDLVAVTHSHLDHWDAPLVTALQHRTGTIMASPHVVKLLEDHSKSNNDSAVHPVGTVAALVEGPQDLKPAQRESTDIRTVVRSVQPGDELTIGDVTVTALRCDHAAVEPLAFQVRTSDGVTVYLPGDTTPYPEMDCLPGPVYSEPLLSSKVDDKRPERQVDVLFWTGTALNDGAQIAQLVNPKVFLSYAISPPAARTRAYSILTGLTSEIPFQALDRHQVFLYPGPGD